MHGPKKCRGVSGMSMSESCHRLRGRDEYGTVLTCGRRTRCAPAELTSRRCRLSAALVSLGVGSVQNVYARGEAHQVGVTDREPTARADLQGGVPVRDVDVEGDAAGGV